jgi:hypothetical protein
MKSSEGFRFLISLRSAWTTERNIGFSSSNNPPSAPAAWAALRSLSWPFFSRRFRKRRWAMQNVEPLTRLPRHRAPVLLRSEQRSSAPSALPVLCATQNLPDLGRPLLSSIDYRQEISRQIVDSIQIHGQHHLGRDAMGFNPPLH